MSKSLEIEVGIYARDGEELDSELAERAGVPRRESKTERRYVFQLRKPSGAVVDAAGEWWAKWREKIIDALAEAVIQRAIDDDDLPLPTQYLAFWPTGPDMDDIDVQGVIRNDYLIKCVACRNGMSEETDSGLCFDCTEGQRTHTG
jgi:hypothetical protein